MPPRRGRKPTPLEHQKHNRVTHCMTDATLARVDALCTARGWPRTLLLDTALREYLARQSPS